MQPLQRPLRDDLRSRYSVLQYPNKWSDALRVVQVQARPILNFILFQRRIDESVLCFGRWIE